MTELNNAKEFRNIDKTRKRLERKQFGEPFWLAVLITFAGATLAWSFAHFLLVQLPLVV